MSSDAANKKHFGGLKDYRASEGREVLVPYRGKVAETLFKQFLEVFVLLVHMLAQKG